MKKELLKELRKNKKFSQDALAKKLGVSQSTLSSWELGLNFPRTDDLEKLCIELETNPNILLGFTDYNEDLLDELAKARNKINDLYEENQKYIFRGDRSGVFFGTLLERNGQEVKIGECRRLWYWDGACSLSEIAKIGTTKPDNCKFTVTVEELTILDCIEIIPCTEKATNLIEEVKEWKRS